MDLLKEVLKRYLSNKITDYAINIDGHWGGGKTHFIKNDMRNVLEGSGDFVLIYISLNGLNDINNMFRSLIFPYGKADDFDDELLKSNALEMIKNNKVKILLCFDDLERIDRRLSISSVLGYINTNFIEHNNVKTIIISNSEEIKEGHRFKKIREKIVGRTIYFTGDILVVVESIIENYSKLHLFYLENKELMESIFKAQDKVNFRSIRFIFEIVDKIFNSLLDEMTELKVNNDILLGIFVFCFLAGMEYKKGTITDLEVGEQILDPFNHYFYRDDINYSNLVRTIRKNNVIFNNLYRYYYSLTEFIINGPFNHEKLISEIKQKYHNKEIEDISFSIIESYYDHELHEITESFPRVINAIEEGYYSPLRYPYMYRIIMEILEKEYICFEGSLEDLFLKGLETAYQKSPMEITDEIRFNRYFEQSDEPTYLKLVNELKKKRRLTIDSLNFSEIEIYINALTRNDYSLISKSISYFSSKKNFFEYLSRKNFEKEFISLSNKSLNSFITTLNEMYLSVSNAYENYYVETPFMLEFKNKLASELEASTKVDKLKKDLLNVVIFEIQKVIDHVNNNKNQSE
jgi:hypothetical protein